MKQIFLNFYDYNLKYAGLLGLCYDGPISSRRVSCEWHDNQGQIVLFCVAQSVSIAMLDLANTLLCKSTIFPISSP